MIGQDKLAEERKRRAFAEYADDRVDERRCADRDHAEQRKMDAMAKMISEPNGQDVEAELNWLLAPELRNVDLMPDAAREKAAARLQERLNSNLHMAEVDGMRVQIQLQPARARLVKVGL